MQNDDEQMKTLLQGWQVPEPRADLAARIVATALAETPAQVVEAGRFDSWVKRLHVPTQRWKAGAAAVALFLAVGIGFLQHGSHFATPAAQEQETARQAEALFAGVTFEDDEEWNEDSVYSYL